MIFIILGTQKFQLNRLLKEIDQYIEKDLIKEEVKAQIGHSDYLPKNYSYERFLDKADFDAQVATASLIITHSGVGSIITALQAGKPVIVFPRMAKYHEHVDDHQLDIAIAFSKKMYVLCCKEEVDLLSMIQQSKEFSFQKYHSQTEKVVEIVKKYVEQVV